MNYLGDSEPELLIWIEEDGKNVLRFVVEVDLAVRWMRSTGKGPDHLTHIGDIDIVFNKQYFRNTKPALEWKTTSPTRSAKVFESTPVRSCQS